MTQINRGKHRVKKGEPKGTRGNTGKQMITQGNTEQQRGNTVLHRVTKGNARKHRGKKAKTGYYRETQRVPTKGTKG